jgi:hypothetical protein
MLIPRHPLVFARCRSQFLKVNNAHQNQQRLENMQPRTQVPRQGTLSEMLEGWEEEN